MSRASWPTKLILSVVAAVALATPALAADLKLKAPPPPAPPPSPWDVAFGAGIQSDYIFRGITQSNHKPSVNAYFEPRYNITPYLATKNVNITAQHHLCFVISASLS